LQGQRKGQVGLFRGRLPDLATSDTADIMHHDEHEIYYVARADPNLCDEPLFPPLDIENVMITIISM